MEKLEIDCVPQYINDGTLTFKEAVNNICSFVVNNYPLFGLHKFDEDFRSEIFLCLLERGEQIIQNYNSNICCFRKYLYFSIQSLIRTKQKYHAKDHEKHTNEGLHLGPVKRNRKALDS